MSGAAGPDASAAEPGRPRVGNLDLLRAGAALAVLAIHAYALGGRVAPIKAQGAGDVPLINLASGVWLFFAISGYVISKPFLDCLVTGGPMPRPGPYALRRALRIFPLYWIVLALFLFGTGLQGTRPWQLAFHLLLLNNLVPGRQEALFAPAWTLTLEVLFYLAVPLLAHALARARRSAPADPRWLARLIAISWAASIAFTVLTDLLGDGTVGLWLRGSLPAMWQMFCPGILLALLSNPRSRRLLRPPLAGRRAAAVALLSLLAAAVLGTAAPLRFGVVPYELISDAARPLYALGYGLVLAAALRSRPWAGRSGRLARLGLISYGIYLIHPLLISYALRHHLTPFRGEGVGAFVLNTLLVAAVTCPLAAVSWRFLERPALQLARRTGGDWRRGGSRTARAGPGSASQRPLP